MVMQKTTKSPQGSFHRMVIKQEMKVDDTISLPDLSLDRVFYLPRQIRKQNFVSPSYLDENICLPRTLGENFTF
jgi:hypothetical protein